MHAGERVRALALTEPARALPLVSEPFGGVRRYSIVMRAS
jgi:hypothetical protein